MTFVLSLTQMLKLLDLFKVYKMIQYSVEKMLSMNKN